MKKILWLSKHDLTNDQIEDLKKIYGNIEITKVDMTVNDGKTVVEIGRNFDILAVVLPIHIQEQLLKLTNKPVISCKNDRIPTGNKTDNGETEYKFKHNHWFQIKSIEIQTKKLTSSEDIDHNICPSCKYDTGVYSAGYGECPNCGYVGMF